MELSHLVVLATMFATVILGFLSKKLPIINNNLIPLQNVLVGLIVALVEWLFTRDFSVAIAVSGILAGGTYDIFHNLEKIVKNG
ncbi:MAG: phage holin family protein [bacterium]|nr:phage holin family protein [bacterium]